MVLGLAFLRETLGDTRVSQLYKHGVRSPLLKCLSRAEGIELMKEIHAELCGSHIGSRPLLGKPSGKDFIGRRQLRMQRIWFKSAKIAKNAQETRNNLRR